MPFLQRVLATDKKLFFGPARELLLEQAKELVQPANADFTEPRLATVPNDRGAAHVEELLNVAAVAAVEAVAGVAGPHKAAAAALFCI